MVVLHHITRQEVPEEEGGDVGEGHSRARGKGPTCTRADCVVNQ